MALLSNEIMQDSRQRVNFITAIWRVIKLTWHFTLGLLRLCVFNKFYTEANKEAFVQSWSNKLLKLLDIQVSIQGKKPTRFNNTLLVANHISWLDILIIFTVVKPRFVAKKEIASWPIVGMIANLGDTIFIERENKRSITYVNSLIAKALQAGSCIAVFPEGKTSLGVSVEPFKSSLFDAVLRSKGQVLPIALQYLDSASSITTRPSFAGDTTLLRSVWNVLTCYKLTVNISFEQTLPSHQFLDRSGLAVASRQKIIKHWL